jgi:hypothetical protein
MNITLIEIMAPKTGFTQSAGYSSVSTRSRKRGTRGDLPAPSSVPWTSL